MQVQIGVHLFDFPIARSNEQVLSTLGKPAIAEVLPRGALVVINMSLYRERWVGNVHAEVAHAKTRDNVERVKAANILR